MIRENERGSSRIERRRLIAKDELKGEESSKVGEVDDRVDAGTPNQCSNCIYFPKSITHETAVRFAVLGFLVYVHACVTCFNS